MDSRAPKAKAVPQEDWSGSQALTRPRDPRTRIDTPAVADALTAVRE
jgi:hypothetical protein